MGQETAGVGTQPALARVLRDAWTGCYPSQWQGICVPEAFAHPAKYSRALIQRLYQHAMAEGWLKAGDTCLDPFGGVGLGGLDAGLAGMQFVGVELEPKFVAISNGFDCDGDLAKHEACAEPGEHGPHHVTGNLELWQRKYGTLLQWVAPRILQGDSRNLQAVLEAADCCVASPPFLGARAGTTMSAPTKGGGPCAERVRSVGTDGDCLGTTPGQLAQLPTGSIDAAIASPPYSSGTVHGGHGEHIIGTPGRPGDVRQSPRKTPFEDYSTNPANLGNLPAGTVDSVISSPPFLDSDGRKGGSDLYRQQRIQTGRNPTSASGLSYAMTQPYGTNPANLGNMPAGDIAACVSSPPYANGCAHTGGTDPAPEHIQGGELRYVAYSASETNLGNAEPTTFWSAAKQILEGVYALLKPGGVAIWVLKAYVRDRQVVDFPGQWRALAERVGFITLHEHHALLVDSHREMGLFGEEVEMYRTESKSFFRRLAEKAGAPEINWETVLCMRKPLGPLPPDESWEQLPLVGAVDMAVSSPPYAESIHDGNGIDHSKLTGNRPGRHTQAGAEGYGTTQGQLGTMRPGDIGAVISSPPYAGAGEVLGAHNGIDYTKVQGTGRRLTPGRQMYPYGHTEGQLGSMPAGEPPGGEEP